MSTHWRRDQPQFYNCLALDRAGLSDPPPPVEGLTGALMSRDDASGARTYVVEIPAGWRREVDGADASLEYFVLRGDLSVDGDRVGASGYVHLPQGLGGGEFGSESGALALAFWNPDMPAFPPPYTVRRVASIWEQPWEPSTTDSHGVMHKALRLPDPAAPATEAGYDGGPGGFLRVMYIAPGIEAPFEHVHHECFEEIILLQGDVLLADEGLLGVGSVVCHPQEWWHGPFASRAGAVILVHTDAPMGYPWPPREYPGAAELCRAYLEWLPWDAPPAHTPWNELTFTDLQSRPEFQAWAASPAAAAFADDVGQGVASAFRASWKRRTT